MNRKQLCWYESRYNAALAYAVVYGCDLSVEQLLPHVLDSDELEQFREHLESQEVGV